MENKGLARKAIKELDLIVRGLHNIDNLGVLGIKHFSDPNFYQVIRTSLNECQSWIDSLGPSRENIPVDMLDIIMVGKNNVAKSNKPAQGMEENLAVIWQQVRELQTNFKAKVQRKEKNEKSMDENETKHHCCIPIIFNDDEEPTWIKVLDIDNHMDTEITNENGSKERRLGFVLKFEKKPKDWTGLAITEDF